MSKIDISIWGRAFKLNAILDHYPDEAILEEQNQALETFVNATAEIEKSKLDIEEYVLKNGLKADSVDNIFKYVMPKSIFVPRKKNGLVAIMCDFKFDDENGIAVVFENGKLKNIGTQDIIL